MEVLSSADVVRSSESDHLDNASSTVYLLTKPVFLDPESSLKLESLPNESVIDGAIDHSITHAETVQAVSIDTGSANAQWKIFGSTFITIFLAELGDKTQVATLLMSAESHAPWVVFTGAATALVTTSLLGVLVGQWLSSRLSPKTLDTAAGIMLALISVWLLWDVVRM